MPQPDSSTRLSSCIFSINSESVKVFSASHFASLDSGNKLCNSSRNTEQQLGSKTTIGVSVDRPQRSSWKQFQGCPSFECVPTSHSSSPPATWHCGLPPFWTMCPE